MNRNNLETIALRARDKARSLGARVAAGATALTGALASTAVMASSNTIGQTASTQIGGAKADVELVQTAMLGVLIVLVVFGLIRKSFGK